MLLGMVDASDRGKNNAMSAMGATSARLAWGGAGGGAAAEGQQRRLIIQPVPPILRQSMCQSHDCGSQESNHTIANLMTATQQ
jgi:hypothetical protein